MALVSLDDYLRLNADKGHVSLLLLLDLSASFSTVDYAIPLRHLEAEVGIRMCLGLAQIGPHRLDLKGCRWRPVTWRVGTVLQSTDLSPLRVKPSG